jgi:hypothetical protein
VRIRLTRTRALARKSPLPRSAIPAGSTTPAWYYAQAILARQAGDQKLSNKHITAARSIYQDANCKLFDESLETVKF